AIMIPSLRKAKCSTPPECAEIGAPRRAPVRPSKNNTRPSPIPTAKREPVESNLTAPIQLDEPPDPRSSGRHPDNSQNVTTPPGESATFQAPMTHRRPSGLIATGAWET